MEKWEREIEMEVRRSIGEILAPRLEWRGALTL
jgi:hypothetical protein